MGLTSTYPGGSSEQSVEFLIRDDGSYAVHTSNAGNTSTATQWYDASSHTLVLQFASDGEVGHKVLITGRPSAGPDGGRAVLELLQETLRTHAGSEVPFSNQPVDTEGIAVTREWHESGPDLPGTVSVSGVLDARSGLARDVLVATTSGSFEQRYELLTIDYEDHPPFLSSFPDVREFSIDPQRPDLGYRNDLGFSFGSLEDVSSALGRKLVVPDRLPEGFNLSEVAFQVGRVGWVGEHCPPGWSCDLVVVDLVFRRGIEAITLTARIFSDREAQRIGATGPTNPYLSDIELGEGITVFDRFSVELHAAGRLGDYVVTAGGDAAGAVLVDLAQSFGSQMGAA